MTDIPAKNVDAIADEKLFQESLISALTEFAYHLPDYQKIEIMMFIHSANYSTTLPLTFLDPLLRSPNFAKPRRRSSTARSEDSSLLDRSSRQQGEIGEAKVNNNTL